MSTHEELDLSEIGQFNQELHNQADWRKFAELGEYYKITFPQLWAKSEQRAYLAHLRTVVPLREHGDGAEKYVDHIHHWEAETYDVYCAAKHLERLEHLDQNDNGFQSNIPSSAFARSLDLAKSILKEHGIEFLGLDNTFVFWSQTRGRFVQIDQSLRAKILTKGQRELGIRFKRDRYSNLDETIINLPVEEPKSGDPKTFPRELLWKRKYPWRGGSMSLNQLRQRLRLEPYTAIWHAINILWQYEQYRSRFEELFTDMFEGHGEVSPERSFWQPELLAAAKMGFELGMSTDAVRKKEFEYKAINLDQSQSARVKASGQKSASNRAQRIEALMQEIEALKDHYPTFSEDAVVEQAAANAIGKNPDLWRQGKGQIETYLSDVIRSREPYKTRYNAVFNKTA